MDAIDANNPNIQVQSLGQRFWYDNIQRSLIQNGELRQLIEDYGVLGITSNPAIFAKAIISSNDYDSDILELAQNCADAKCIYERFAIADIQAAADMLEPIYEQTQGLDGYVSLEVSPFLARDCNGTIAEARRLNREVARKNLMVKVPATSQCIPAIQQLIEDGININVTLIFSLNGYEQVARAFIAGLAARAQKGQSLNVASVASFFVSRVDVLVDKLLDEKIALAAEQEKAHLTTLKAKSAIANAKLAYEIFTRIFAEKEWQALAKQGARPQRVLWASTSTKNPTLPATYYADALIGPQTVNTLPPATLKAFFSQGTASTTLTCDLKAAHKVMKDLAAAGISMQQVWQKLQDDGVTLFADAFKSLLASVDGKLAAVAVRGHGSNLGDAEAYVGELVKLKAAAKVWAKDAAFWSTEPEHVKLINNRLGWLNSTTFMRDRITEIKKLREDVIAARYTDVIVLGMGGSALAAETLRQLFAAKSTAEKAKLRLHVLDTTDPITVRHLTESIDDLCKTLFIVASKSGSTIEITSFYTHFRSKMDACAGEAAGMHFVAITDENTPLQQLAAAEQFRHVFINPANMGGRYSALSYFGLVAAGLMGLNLDMLLDRAEAMARACKYDSEVNPGLWLGAIIGGAALIGRDKLTFIMSPQIASFGLWVEQLIAESTGKRDRGVVPIIGDEANLKQVDRLGKDRLFVHFKMAGDITHDKLIGVLKKAGMPLIEITLADLFDIGAEFFRWQFATAIAGAVLGVNPFDEPNVAESKTNTKRLLGEYERTGQFMIEASSRSPNGQLNKFLRSAKAGDYVSVQAYLPYLPQVDDLLQKLRVSIGTRYGAPVTVGYGPRFLHSTGQLHKGGANNIVVLQLTYDADQDMGIPGEPYTFGTLMRAQALGDYEAHRAHFHRVMRLHLGKDPTAALKKLVKSTKGQVRKPVAKKL